MGFGLSKCPHYTRYGLDYHDDDDDEDMGEDLDDGQLSAPPDSLDPYKTADMSVMEIESDNESSHQEDTFSFKQKTVPGGFGRQPIIEDAPEHALVHSIENDSEHSAMSEEEASDGDMDMAGSYPEPTGHLLNFESTSKPCTQAQRTRYAQPASPRPRRRMGATATAYNLPQKAKPRSSPRSTEQDSTRQSIRAD